MWEHLKTQPEFEIDKQIDHKLLTSIVPVRISEEGEMVTEARLQYPEGRYRFSGT